MDQEQEPLSPNKSPDESDTSDSPPSEDKGTLLVVGVCGLVAALGLIMMMNGGDNAHGKAKGPDPVSPNEIDNTVAPEAAPGISGTGTATTLRVSLADLAQMQLELPPPAFIGTPKNDKHKVNIDPIRRGKRRKPYVIPAGLVNVADKCIVTSSDNPFLGHLNMVTNGDKDYTEGTFVDLAGGKQWIQIDLKHKHDVFAIMIWHKHDMPTVYRDVVIQISNDPNFKQDVLTVFNNDDDNSSGLGAGADFEYYESDEGELVAKTSGVDVQGRKRVTESLGRARYVRLWSNGSIDNEYNHYTEVEVFAKPVN